MLETNAMVTVSLHYWAGARAAAGVAEEHIEARSVAEALRFACDVRSDPRFDKVIKASSVLIVDLRLTRRISSGRSPHPYELRFSPPFAGGSEASTIWNAISP